MKNHYCKINLQETWIKYREWKCASPELDFMISWVMVLVANREYFAINLVLLNIILLSARLLAPTSQKTHQGNWWRTDFLRDYIFITWMLDPRGKKQNFSSILLPVILQIVISGETYVFCNLSEYYSKEISF